MATQALEVEEVVVVGAAADPKSHSQHCLGNQDSEDARRL